MAFAMVFPGQGSQSVGMLAGHIDSSIVRDTLGVANEALGFDLAALIATGPAEKLNQTEHTQPALLAAGVAIYRLWQEQGGATPTVMLGHSLGEYTALVNAGALDFADAVRLVAKRGQLMQQAVPAGEGAMAAVLGLGDAEVIAVCAQSAGDEVVSAVNFNAPGQVVIAGHTQAVDRAAAAAKAAGAKLVKKLPVSVPSHCALMRDAADELSAVLDTLAITAPEVPVIHNVNAQSHNEPQAIRDALTAQLHSPVRWVSSMQQAAEQYAVDTVVESGPGKVLSGLIKRIDRSITLHNCADSDALAATLAASIAAV